MSSSLAIEAHGLVKRYGEKTALGGDRRRRAGRHRDRRPRPQRRRQDHRRPHPHHPRRGPTRAPPPSPASTSATHPTEVRRRIGLAAQDATVDPLLTGRENLVMIGELHQLARREAKARADELLEQFDLADAGDKVVGGYSGGMRRRLDLAATLVADPEVLFLDEPTTGLDPRARNELWDVLDTLVGGGTTILLTTQYLEEADRLADDILVIDHGKVIAHGDARSLKRQVGGDNIGVTVSDVAPARRGRRDPRPRHRRRARDRPARPHRHRAHPRRRGRPGRGGQRPGRVRARGRGPQPAPAHPRRGVPHPHRHAHGATTNDARWRPPR